MPDKRAHLDLLIARIAARQHGVISIAQLIYCGLSRSTVAGRVAAGRLYPVYRGVYAVGHPGVTTRGRWKAATLALGRGAVLSHRSAAELWGMLPERGEYPHVTVPGNGGRRRRERIRISRSVSLAPQHVTSRDGIPVTRPARTLADLERTASPAELRAARRQAAYDGLPLAEGDAGDGTRSDLEGDFRALVRGAGIPDPEAGVRIGPYTVDFLWREQRLVVEVDGWAARRGWQAFQDDHVRDAYLTRVGLSVQRFSDWQIDNEPAAVLATVRARLRER